MSVLEELGIVILDINPLEVLLFNKFSGFWVFPISPHFSPRFNLFFLFFLIDLRIAHFVPFCLFCRVVTEAHSSVTRKNREWQEKLPCVVLKAEEIMYSKANSEVIICWVFMSFLYLV